MLEEEALNLRIKMTLLKCKFLPPLSESMLAPALLFDDTFSFATQQTDTQALLAMLRKKLHLYWANNVFPITLNFINNLISPSLGMQSVSQDR